MNRNVLLLVLAILSFCLAALAAQAGDGDIILGALAWLGIGGALFAAAHLPA